MHLPRVAPFPESCSGQLSAQQVVWERVLRRPPPPLLRSAEGQLLSLLPCYHSSAGVVSTFTEQERKQQRCRKVLCPSWSVQAGSKSTQPSLGSFCGFILSTSYS